MEDEQLYEILDSRGNLVNPLPSGLTRKRDGFSRGDVVHAFSRTFELIGGVQRLALWANANPGEFYKLYSKLLPSTSFNFGPGEITKILHAIPRSKLDEHE